MNSTFSDLLLRSAAATLIQTLQQPWFVYVPLQAVHAPLQVPAQYLARYPQLTGKEQTKAGMLTALDDALGIIFKALAADPSVEMNTITLWFSDNGAPLEYGGSNLPLRGQKHTLYEGGMKVPTLLRSPLLPASLRGTENGKLYSVVDWLPTFVKLAGGSTAKNRPLDGYDIWPSLIGAGSADGADAARDVDGVPSPRTELFHCAVDPSRPKTSMKGPWAALRVGSLKLLQGKKGNLSLYNISADPVEAHDLAAAPGNPYAAELEAMQERLEWYRNGSVPGWAPEEACSAGLGPVTVKGSLVWAPTCRLAPTPPTPRAPTPPPTPSKPTPAPGPAADCATGAGMLNGTCYSPHHNEPTQIRNFSASSARACCTACEQQHSSGYGSNQGKGATKPCLAWTWRQGIDGLCVLLDESSPHVVSNKHGCTSGRRAL
jgi:hypothetical protein